MYINDVVPFRDLNPYTALSDFGHINTDVLSTQSGSYMNRPVYYPLLSGGGKRKVPLPADDLLRQGLREQRGGALRSAGDKRPRLVGGSAKNLVQAAGMLSGIFNTLDSKILYDKSQENQASLASFVSDNLGLPKTMANGLEMAIEDFTLGNLDKGNFQQYAMKLANKLY